ncbi:MAG: cation:proton antiporter regulatory subunit, partial [Halobacteriaceae archaeon]
EGHPPIPDEVRSSMQNYEQTFPADLSISELEQRVSDDLMEAFELSEVNVTIDTQARAAVTAAPMDAGVSRRVPGGQRAVSISALVPTGLARGDEVTVLTEDGTITGTVLSAKSGASPTVEEAASESEPPVEQARAPTTTGGMGRVTIAVTRDEARVLVRVDVAPIIVKARGTGREYEFISLLRRAGGRLRRATIDPGSHLAGQTIAEANIRDQYGIAILALRAEGESRWTIAPKGSVLIAGGAELYIVGPAESISQFQQEVSE